MSDCHIVVVSIPLLRQRNKINYNLIVSSPLVSNGYASKCSGPYWSNPPFLSFWHSGTLALSRERQSARMSKIKKGGLDQHGAERFGRLILPQSEKVWDWKG